jgi:NAD(P)-dependent dehydrogenase (short-subunit alcohol dehydrogenase family)
MTPRLALVTGANRGIGQAITHQLRDAGVRVLAASREQRDGYLTLDVTVPQHIQHAESLVHAEGGLDVLVNNAGASLHGFDADVVRRTLEVNFYGPQRLTDALLPAMRPNARIVMVSSSMGELSHVTGEARARFEDPSLTRGQLVDHVESFVRAVETGEHTRKGWPSSAYSVSKIALNALVRVMARELSHDPRKIRINAACPGWVRTRMGGGAAPRSVDEGARTPAWLALQADGGPTGGFFRDDRPVPW